MDVRGHNMTDYIRHIAGEGPREMTADEKRNFKQARRQDEKQMLKDDLEAQKKAQKIEDLRLKLGLTLEEMKILAELAQGG